MHTIQRMITNICSDNLSASRDFYTSLLDFAVDYDSDWFVHLISKDRQLELGIIDRTYDLVPEAFQQKPQGFYLTFVVENADIVFEKAKSQGFEVLSEPENTFYGQRRFLLKDPNGTLVDISSPTKAP
ncbi:MULTISPECIES: VOC family protein [unclassified Roseivirga]|uniref:VOC family protein n=1 Tax=unclassified Roseivirga TaxID=2626142 RepID=UPI00257AFE71|nr:MULTISPECIES: VOC family protein [unclassified Roseivirga]MEC7755917.1 VOC family protein [Bacteroidota bacterium]|tara:strand:+ start:4845 stop:5228 length:384 start_codon:yes stop_codon:yes gene_type:complete